MIRLKELLLEYVTGTITSGDIYNFYFLFYYNQFEPNLLNTSYARDIEREYLYAIKEKYLSTFKALLAEQINKYIGRKRMDPDFPTKQVSETDSAETLEFLMAKTFRSDMKRRNDVWNIAARATAQLEKITNPKLLYAPINALNMAVHNTNTLILGKLGGGYGLMQAYDACANADPKYYVGRVSKDLRDLLKNPEPEEPPQF